MSVFVRARGDKVKLFDSIREQILSVHKEIVCGDRQALEQTLADQIQGRHISNAALLVWAGFSIAIAGVSAFFIVARSPK